MIRARFSRRLASRAGALGAPALLTLAAWGSLAAQQGTANPHGDLPGELDCAACHTSEEWQVLLDPLAFEHGAESGFVLYGVHARTPCVQCHLDLHFDGPDIDSEECASCHVDVHEGRMVEPCSACHSNRSFHDVDGELVHARTAFPLTGAHRGLTCEACHASDVGGAFSPLEVDCVSCHAAAYQGARTVDHVANAYPTDCTQCHSTQGWEDSPAFDHAAVANGFTLVDVHSGLRCASCHQVPGLEALFFPTSQEDCIACHQADFDGEHGGSSFPTTCLDCHDQRHWEDAHFDHEATGFPLVGAHARISCEACHRPPANLSTLPAGRDDCFACHEPDYNRAHRRGSVPTTCSDCHNQRTWDDDAPDRSPDEYAAGACFSCHPRRSA